MTRPALNSCSNTVRTFPLPESDARPIVRPTTIIESVRLTKLLGCDVVLASETFQHTGSFKFRAAYHVASIVPQNMLIAASSGNFGQALAYACSLLKKSCIIVMPTTSAKVKVDAVRKYGGTVDFVNVQTKSRDARVQELAREHSDAYVASAYDDPLVIEGNSSLGRELASLHRRLDAVVVPIGGGGLISGVISGWNQMSKQIEIIGAEPFRGNDAARSLRSGQLVRNDAEPQTIADGARTISLGAHNWKIIQKRVSTIIEISEATIVEAVRVLFELANLKAEPTGALSVAALMTSPDLFRNRAVCCVISGGNVDPGVYREIL